MARQGKKQRERERRQRRAQRVAVSRSAPGGARAGLASAAYDPVRGGDAEFIDPIRQWYIVRTLPRMGARAERELREVGITTFLPRTSQVVVRRGMRVIRYTPLVFRTLFIGVWRESALDLVRTLPGIAEVVTYADVECCHGGNVSQIVRRPARLDPAHLQRFVNAIALGEIVQPVGVSVGSTVIVRSGPFAGFPAVVGAIMPGDRLRVAVSIFGRPSRVDLGIADVQPI